MTLNHAWMLARASAKRWEGHVQAGLLSREINGSGCRRRKRRRKATSLAALSRVARGPRAVGRTRACTESLCARTGRSHVLPVPLISGRATQGTPRRAET
jgi:hypothetical protein